MSTSCSFLLPSFSPTFYVIAAPIFLYSILSFSLSKCNGRSDEEHCYRVVVVDLVLRPARARFHQGNSISENSFS